MWYNSQTDDAAESAYSPERKGFVPLRNKCLG